MSFLQVVQAHGWSREEIPKHPSRRMLRLASMVVFVLLRRSSLVCVGILCPLGHCDIVEVVVA